jgi:hypothetical protein
MVVNRAFEINWKEHNLRGSISPVIANLTELEALWVFYILYLRGILKRLIMNKAFEKQSNHGCDSFGYWRAISDSTNVKHQISVFKEKNLDYLVIYQIIVCLAFFPMNWAR